VADGLSAGALGGLSAGAPGAQNLTHGTVLATRIEVAASLVGKFFGLMGRQTLDDGAGLWLPGGNGIHMMFMRFPIDAVFLGRPDGTGRRPVVGLRRALRPWLGVVWYVRGANGVIELPVGAIDASSTAVGDLVSVEEARAA
jgi:uncharacterized protein